MDVCRAGTLNVSNRICAAVSRFERGLSGGSVSRTGCWRGLASDYRASSPTAFFFRAARFCLTSSLSVFSPSPYTYSQIFSMSSQSVTMPCSSGYLILSSPLSSVAALCPMKTSPSSAPASTRRCFGRPTHDGNMHFGRSSPANPARIVPDPLSRTIGALWRLSAIVTVAMDDRGLTTVVGSMERATSRPSWTPSRYVYKVCPLTGPRLSRSRFRWTSLPRRTDPSQMLLLAAPSTMVENEKLYLKTPQNAVSDRVSSDRPWFTTSRRELWMLAWILLLWWPWSARRAGSLRCVHLNGCRGVPR